VGIVVYQTLKESVMARLAAKFAAGEWAMKNSLKQSSNKQSRALHFQQWYDASPYLPREPKMLREGKCGGNANAHMKNAWSKYQDEMARVAIN
jgi:hypothetical protein